MKSLSMVNNPYGDDKVISACSIFGMMDTSGEAISGEPAFKAVANMHDRGNGLGGGFAVYGLYPEYADFYALHVMFASQQGRHYTEQFLDTYFRVEHSQEIPTRKTPGITDEPMVYRYFVQPRLDGLMGMSEDDYVVEKVLVINSEVEDSFVFSSGKNMGVFKGVGFPEQIAEYFRLEDYKGHIWTVHGRFPTNSQAWWGGAHPFSMLD